jgi:hypothetical protein
LSLNTDGLLILAAASIDGCGEYRVERGWNKPWGADCADMKDLESLGFMKIMFAGRDPVTKQWFRRSVITEAGRVVLAATQQ